MSEQDLDSLIRLLDALERIKEQRRAATYDGVLGKLPEWVPKWHQHKFNETRNRLLDRYLFGERLQHEQIVAWINEFCVRGEENEGQFAPFIPREISKQIEDLAHLRYVVSLGSEKGLIFLAGKEALTGMKVRQGAKKANEQGYGTAEEKKQRWERLQTEVDRLYEDNPERLWKEIAREAAANMSCSFTTIERHCQNPKKR